MARIKKPKKEKTIHELRILTLRRASMRWKYKYECLNKAKVYMEVGTFKNGNTKQGVFYICAECERQEIEAYYKRTEVQVDHIIEIAGEEGFSDWNKYVPALLCPENELQVLCIPHHKEKTSKYMRKKNESNKTKK